MFSENIKSGKKIVLTLFHKDCIYSLVKYQHVSVPNRSHQEGHYKCFVASLLCCVHTCTV